jgi:hypothetical protein
MKKISWTDHVRNQDVLLRVKEQRNILHEIRKRKANWISHILRRNCLLQRVIEGKIQGGIEVTGGRGIRRRKLLDNLKKRRGYSRLKEEALDRTMWRAGFGRGFGPVVRQTTKWITVLTGNTPGRRQFTNLTCKCENITLFFLQKFTTYKGEEFLTGSRVEHKKRKKAFSNGEWGRKPPFVP